MVTASFIRRMLTVAVLGTVLCAGGVRAAEHGGSGGGQGEGGAPPPVNTNLHPDAVILNARNPLAIHAGPGKPNVGSVYLPPSTSGKDKKAKSGQTEEKVMGATPAH
jgi:hypothetical protein